jgi:hypothetical protein
VSNPASTVPCKLFCQVTPAGSWRPPMCSSLPCTRRLGDSSPCDEADMMTGLVFFWLFPHASPDNVSPRYQARRLESLRWPRAASISRRARQCTHLHYTTPEIKAYQNEAPFHIAKRGNPGPMSEVYSGAERPVARPPSPFVIRDFDRGSILINHIEKKKTPSW